MNTKDMSAAVSQRATERFKLKLIQEGFAMAKNNEHTRSCPICGAEIDLAAAKHYIARDDASGGLSAALSNCEPSLYDAFDCPVCKCQIIIGERKREERVVLDADTLTIVDLDAEAKTEEEIDAGIEAEERIAREQVARADLEAAADVKDEWTANVLKAGRTHSRRVSEEFVRGLIDAAYAYAQVRRMSFPAFCQKWCTYLEDPRSSVDDAYAMARVRTRNAGHRRRKEGDGK